MKGVKLCVTCVKIYKKAKEIQVAPHFVDELKKNGMPQCKEDDLMETGRATWQEDKLDHIVVYSAEIIGDSSLLS